MPLTEPVGIVSEAGTVRLVELELRPTMPPPDPLRVTVQVLEALGARVPGVQVDGGDREQEATLTVPPVPVTAISSPAGEAPRLLLTATGTSVLPDRVTDTVATTPSEMELEFNPQATHV